MNTWKRQKKQKLAIISESKENGKQKNFGALRQLCTLNLECLEPALLRKDANLKVRVGGRVRNALRVVTYYHHGISKQSTLMKRDTAMENEITKDGVHFSPPKVH